jgi:hypothetical protein
MDFVPLGYIAVGDAFAQLFDHMGGSDPGLIQIDDEGWQHFDRHNSEIYNVAKELMTTAFEENALVVLVEHPKSHRFVQVDRSYWKRQLADLTLSCSRLVHMSLPYANRNLADEVCFLEQVQWNNWLSTFRSGKSAVPSIKRERGRSTGTGYQALDAPFVDEMRQLIQGPEQISKWNAALKLAPRTAGGGTNESKAKRLVKGYSAKFRV